MIIEKISNGFVLSILIILALRIDIYNFCGDSIYILLVCYLVCRVLIIIICLIKKIKNVYDKYANR